MKLSRLLVSLISLLWVLVFIATLVIVIENTKDYLQRTLESHAQDAATSLGLSITHSGRVKDADTVERMAAAIFDRGYYREILVKRMDGTALVAKRVEEAVKEVPGWFIDAFSLATPRMNAIVMDGWRQAATVEVVSHPGFAYAELWRVSGHTAWVLLFVGIASFVVVIVVLRLALRPLDEMEAQAINISKRQFTVVEKLPWARELHRVAIALNTMCLAVERMLGEQTALTEKMRKKAYVDNVTGLMNRNDFSERLNHLISTPEEFGSGALAIIRIRGFAAYNERNGRVAGDSLLQRTAQLLGKVCDRRENAILARLDGPEFGMMVPDIAEADLPALGEELISGLAEIEEFPRTDNSVMAHVGIAHYQHHEGASFGKLMAAVNSALAVAQARSVPAWHVQEGVDTKDKAAAALSAQISDLFKAGLSGDRVVMQYQPVRPCQAAESAWRYRSEAWVRIVGEDGSLVPAGLFIPVAKRLGALEHLDRLVIEKVMQHISARGPVLGGATAINLSQESILEPRFVDWLHGKLVGQPDVAQHIIVEVAEQSIINKIESIKTAFHRLREAGARCSIDRFGQSTASVGFLRSLEIDYIKIDGSYTRGIIQSTDRQFFVQALVGIAHGLGIQVLTEYIENEQEFEMVKSLMVDGAQGYYIGKPE